MLLGEAQPGWTHLHVEFYSGTSEVTASLTTAEAGSVPRAVPAGVAEALTGYYRQAAAAGDSWQLLVIDCDADGRLSARTDPVATVRPRRWPRRVLTAVTVACLAAAAVIFAVGWRWSEPARLGVLGVPPSEREQAAFAVLKQWYEAENRGDATRLHELACAHPTQSLTDWINSIAYYGQDQGLIFPDALTQFRDNGSTLWVKVAVRIRPVDERMKREVEEAQARGGFFFETVTLAEESGNFKVCDGQR